MGGLPRDENTEDAQALDEFCRIHPRGDNCGARVSKRVPQEVRTVCCGLSLKKLAALEAEIGLAEKMLPRVQFRMTMVALAPPTVTVPKMDTPLSKLSRFVQTPRSRKPHESKSAVLSVVITAELALLPRRLLNTESAYQTRSRPDPVQVMFTLDRFKLLWSKPRHD